MTSFRRILRDEDGATAVLIALVLPVMLSMLGYGSEVLAITGGERELQRTADVTALAAASQTPVLDAGAVQGYPLAGNLLSGVLAPSTTVEDTGCPTGDAAAAGSTLLVAFSQGVPTCDNGGITLTRDTDAATVLGEMEQFLTALTTSVPVVGPQLGSPVTLATTLLTQVGLPVDVSALAPAVTTPEVTATVAAEVSTPFRQLISDSAGSPLRAEATARRRFKNVVLLPVLDTCQPLPTAVPLTPAVTATLKGLLGGPQLAGLLDANGMLDLGQLSGALLGTLDPLVRVTVQVLPLPDLIAWFGGLNGVIGVLGVDAVLATVVPGSTLPLNALPGLVGGTTGSTPDILDTVVAASTSLEDAVGDLYGSGVGAVNGLLAAATGTGCTINPNVLLQRPAADTMAALRASISALRVLPVPGIAHLANALDLLADDLEDVVDPGTAAPTAGDILAAAAAADEDVLVVLVGSTQIPLLDLFVAPGAATQTLVTNAADPSVGQLTTDLSNLQVATANANGAFRAELVR